VTTGGGEGGVGAKLHVVKLRGHLPRYDKSLRLRDIEPFLDAAPYGESWDDYVKPGLQYFLGDASAVACRDLGVASVHPMGLYIRGIYGGERKKGKEEYAGLALVEYGRRGARFEFKLHNTEEALVVPLDSLERHHVGVYRVVYEGEINPFRLRRYVHVLLSRRGEQSLKEFLREALTLNSRSVSQETLSKVERLIEELKQPSRVQPLNTARYYVAFRCDRIFTAFAFKPEEDTVVESHVAYAECLSEDIAYYYAAVLNYLAYKLVKLGRAFGRHQYARPLLVACAAGLAWGSLDDEARRRVVECSKLLHSKSPRKEYRSQRDALAEVARLPEFREVERLLDSRVDEKRLEEALSMVSRRSSREEE